MHLLGEESSERYEYIPAQFLVIEDVCKKYACDCTVRTATKPPQPIAKSSAGASLLAQVIVGKITDHLPLYRQAKIFKRFGIDIPDQTMGGWLRQSAELLTPLYNRLKVFVLSSKVTGRRCDISSRTGVDCQSDRPKSPFRMPPIQRTYCSIIG